MKITHLRSVTITTPDVAGLVDFYEQIWGLARCADADGAVYLRGAGTEHHILAIHPAEQASVRGYALGLADRAAVDAAAEELAADPRTELVREPAPLDTPGGGYGLVMTDPDGREIELSADVAEAGPADHDATIRPVKVAHVVLNSSRQEAYAELLVETLGFRLADETQFMQFWKCNLDHHSVAVARAPHPSLNHIAFEVPTLDDVLASIEYMRGHGYETVWGPGRHPQGMNVFGYYVAPNGQVVEYTSEVEQIDDADLAPRLWMPEDYEVYDDWADESSLRPVPETREVMLGEPEPTPHPAPAGG